MNELISIPASMILARMLTPHDFGVAAAAGFFVQIAQRLTNFGLNTALVQRKELHHAHKSSVFVLNLAAGVVVWLALTFGAGWLASAFRSEDAGRVLPIAALSFLIAPLGSVSSALMVRDLRFREIVMLDVFGVWTTTVLGLVLAWLGYGYWSLVYSSVAGVATHSVVRLLVAGWWPSLQFSGHALRELLSFGLGLHFKRLLDSAAQNIDNLVVGRTLGITSLGFYDKAFAMMNRVLSTLGAATPAVSLRILSVIGDDDVRFRAAYRKILLASAFVSYPMLTALIVVAPELFFVMFGAQWHAAVAPFQLLCVVAAFKFINGYASIATQSRGRVWGEVLRQIAYVVLIIIGVAAGSRWGLAGAAAGVLAATVSMTLTMHDFLCRTTAVTWRDVLRPQVPALTCAMGLMVCMLCLRVALDTALPTQPAPLLLLISLGVVAAVYMLAFLRLIRFEDLDVVLRETISETMPRLTWLLPRPRPNTVDPE